MKPIIIAIDGYSSTGKSTLAKKVAKTLNFTYIDTGAMYRAVAFRALQKGWACSEKGLTNPEDLIKDLPNIELEFRFDKSLGYAPIYLNGVNIEKEIRGLQVSNLVSYVAKILEVREKLVQSQQEMGKNKAIVMDGRDIGTVVFPGAELKLFLTASPKIRAQRRYDELISKGEEITYNQVYDNLIKRDKIDSSRSVSPLKKANDAIEIDNSNLTIEEQVEKIVILAKEV